MQDFLLYQDYKSGEKGSRSKSSRVHHAHKLRMFHPLANSLGGVMAALNNCTILIDDTKSMASVSMANASLDMVNISMCYIYRNNHR
jgi:hypothetical protein